MSGSVSMNHVVHGAVRRDLERLVRALDAVRDADRGRAQELKRGFDNLRDQLTRHHQGEDKWIWPMLADVGVDPELLATMESEHHSMAEALAETDAAMGAYAASGSAADATTARDSVLRTQEVVNQHLAHEEGELEPVLAPHLVSPEWKEVEKKLSRQPPSVAGPFFAWLTDGMTEENRAALRSMVPAPVILILSRVFGRRYHREVAPVWRESSSG